MFEPEENDEFAIERCGKANFPLAECFGGPVDGSHLPVPVEELGVIISGYNHETGDMMHYQLHEHIDDETGHTRFIYKFMEAENAPNLSFPEFMHRAADFDDQHNGTDYDGKEVFLFEEHVEEVDDEEEDNEE